MVRRHLTSVQVKRVYEKPGPGDGTRILVDRLWPRGLTKDKAGINFWLKEIAPSHSLRKRFHGKPDDWDAFCAAYSAELGEEAAHGAVTVLLGHLREGPMTLLYAARDETRNNAIALRAWLQLHHRIGRKS